MTAWGAVGLRGPAVQRVLQEETRLGAENGCAVWVGLLHFAPGSLMHNRWRNGLSNLELRPLVFADNYD